MPLNLLMDIPRPGLTLHGALSQALVAFTIEFDNEAEHRMPHRTSTFNASEKGRKGPWLVSMVMWFNCIRFVGEQAVTVKELEHLARTRTNLAGMQRWGYITMDPKGTIAATRAGRMAYAIWKPLLNEIELRWHERFGSGTIAELREALAQIAFQLPMNLPDCMPIVEYGQRTPNHFSKRVTAETEGDSTSLAALLTKVLLQFTLDFEAVSRLSLPICANVIRLIPEDGIRVRDLPALSGIAKEAIDLSLAFLQKHDLVMLRTREPGRSRIASLRPAGSLVQKRYEENVANLEREWCARYGQAALDSVRDGLRRVTGNRQLLLEGVKPYPNNWRANLPSRSVLPLQPVVTHRGGYPDGS